MPSFDSIIVLQEQETEDQIYCVLEPPPGDGYPREFTCHKKNGNTVRCCGIYICCPGIGPNGAPSPGMVILGIWIALLLTVVPMSVCIVLLRSRQRKREMLKLRGPTPHYEKGSLFGEYFDYRPYERTMKSEDEKEEDDMVRT